MENDDGRELFEEQEKMLLKDYFKVYFDDAYGKYVEKRDYDEIRQDYQKLLGNSETGTSTESDKNIPEMASRLFGTRKYNQTTLCEAKAKVLRDVIESISTETLKAWPEVENRVIGQSAIKNSEFYETTEDYSAGLNQLLDDEYDPPNDMSTVICQLYLLFRCYEYGAQIHPEILMKLDVTSFKLLPVGGQLFGTISPEAKKLKHQNGVLTAKKKQKDKTIDKVLNAYKKIGAQWCSDEPQKKPILLKNCKKNNRCSVNKLAETIFLDLKEITPRHINNYLKELHEKGEI